MDKLIHTEDKIGNDENSYRIKVFEGDKNLESAINIVTILNGEENEDNVYRTSYPLHTNMLEILESLRMRVISSHFN